LRVNPLTDVKTPELMVKKQDLFIDMDIYIYRHMFSLCIAESLAIDVTDVKTTELMVISRYVHRSTYEADPTKSRPDDKPFGAARSRSSSSLRPSPCAQSRSGLRQGGPPGVERPRARSLDRSAGLPLTCAAMTVPVTVPANQPHRREGMRTGPFNLYSLSS